jgi:putative cell wall-binding protein
MHLRRLALPFLVSLLAGVLASPAASAVDTYTGAWMEEDTAYDATALTMTGSDGSNRVFFDATFNGVPYGITFRAPVGQVLSVGAYEGAQSFCAATDPCLSLAAHHDSSAQFGRFIVDEISWDGSGHVLAFGARFELQYDDWGLFSFGAVYYNASVEHRTRSISSSLLDFGKTYDGAPTSEQLTITNNGPSDLNPANFSVDADSGFVLAGTTCSGALTAGQSCSVTVSFEPDAPGNYDARMRFTDELAPLGPPGAADGTGDGREIILRGTNLIDFGTERIAGTDRIATSIAASQSAFADQGAGAVVLSRKDGFADALAGAPLAVAIGAPLMLTGTATLDVRVASEIQRVLPEGGTVLLLGGTSAISSTIEGQLFDLGYGVGRFAGDNRYATAVEVAHFLNFIGTGTMIMIATGTDFPDALSAGAAAAHQGAVVVLSAGSKKANATTEYLAERPGVYAVCIGGPACKAYPTSTKVIGTNRYATSRLIAEEFFWEPLAVGVASGRGYADALSGGPHLWGLGPLLLTEPSDLPTTIGTYLHQERLSIVYAAIYGGAGVVHDSVLDEVDGLVQAE